MRLRGVWGLAEGAASAEEGGGLRAGAERGRGRLRGEGGRESGVNRLWRGEKRRTVSTRAPSSHHPSSQPRRRVSLHVSHCPSGADPPLEARARTILLFVTSPP